MSSWNDIDSSKNTYVNNSGRPQEIELTSTSPVQPEGGIEEPLHVRFTCDSFEVPPDKQQLIEEESSDEDSVIVQRCVGAIVAASNELVAATQIVKRVQDQTRRMQLKAAVVFIIFVFLLPLCLLAACMFRYNFTSFIYFVFLLALPFIDSPVTSSLHGNHCLKFVIILTILSGVAMGGQGLLEILVVAGVVNLKTDMVECSPTESMLRQIGFVSYQYPGVTTLDIIRLFLPDLAVCFTSLLLLILIRCILPADKRQNYSRQGSAKLPSSSQAQLTTVSSRRTRPLSGGASGQQQQPANNSLNETNSSLAEFGLQLVKFINFMLIVACATAAPSILTAPYILLILLMGALWAFRRPVDPGETVSLKVVTLTYIIGHLSILYLYQFPFLRNLLPPFLFASRIIGLMPITDTNCLKPPTRLLLEEDLGYSQIALPTFLFVTYAFMAFRHKITQYYEGLRRQSPSRLALIDRARSVQQANAAFETVSADNAKPSRSAVGNLAQQRVPSPLPEESEETAGLLQKDGQTGPSSSGTEPSTSSASQRPPSGLGSKREQGTETTPGSPAPRPLIPFLPFIPDAATKIFRRGENALLPPMSPPPPPQYKLSPLDTLYSLFSAYSYVFSLLSMMTWSVTHFSILTLVLLVSACILWMVPNSRRACVIVSPLIVLYAKMLIAIEFIYGMNMEESELKSYKEIGLVRYGTSHPGMLAAELMYLFPFWLLLRQRIDKYLASGNLNIEMTSSAETADAVTKAIQIFGVITAISEKKSIMSSKVELNRFVLKMITFMLDQLSVYWIFLCFIMVLIQACTGPTTIINFVYMLVFMTTSFFFILSFKIWRRLLFTTCWFLCLYSMAVLLGIYIYQFEAVENWLDVNATTHLWNDLGLNKHNTAPALFQALILPALTLMVLVLQLQFFHQKLLRMTECVVPKRPSHQSDEDAVSDSETQTSHDHSIASNLKDEPLIDADWWRKTSAIFSVILQYMWRLLEVHMFKVVMIVAACLAIVQVSAVNMPLLFAVVSLLPLIVRYNRQGPRIISSVVYLGVCFAVIFKMGYQLNMVKEYTYMFEENCTRVDYKNETRVMKESLVEWLGLQESNNMLIYLQLYIVLIILFLVQQIVNVRQNVYRFKLELDPPPPGVVFPHITRKEADRSVFDLIMYFINYGFYKFGLEISWVSTIVVIATRLDSFSLVYAIPLVMQLWMPRKICARFYPFYVFFLVLVLLGQYCACVGFPFYFACGKYPWDTLIDQQLRRWLVLPSSLTPDDVNCTKLIGDFFQLLLATCQLSVFRIEAQGNNYAGGDNSDALPNMAMYYENPVHDFISEKKSLLDELKAVVFELMFWITILVLFGAGVSEVNVFSLIYLIVCFILLWYGQSLLIKPIDQLIRTWHIILALNVFVIIVKAGLQLVACMDLYKSENKDSCNVRQVFDLVCVSPALKSDAPKFNCVLPTSRTPLASDIAAFVFLLIMKRLYRSHYFQHVVRDFDIQSSLASLGASLIMHRQQEQLKREQEAENKRVDRIRTKIERIRQRQNISQQQREKLQSACGGTTLDTVDQQTIVRPEPDHYRVVRGGYYYMFDEKESDEEDPAALLSGSQPHSPNQAPSKIEKTPIDVVAEAVMKKQTTTITTSSMTHLPRVVSASMSSAGQIISPGDIAAVQHHLSTGEGQPLSSTESPVPGSSQVVQPSPSDLAVTDGLRQRRSRSASGSSQVGVGPAPSHPPASDIDYISEAVEPGGEEQSEPDENPLADDQQELNETAVSATSWRQHLTNAGVFIYELFYSSLTSLINLLNSLTFEHYLVRRRLKRQIEIQKTSSRRQGIVPGEVNRQRSGHRKQGSTASAISLGSAYVSTGPVPSLALPALPPAVSAAGSTVARQAVTAVVTSEPQVFSTFIPEELTEEEEKKEREEIEAELRNHSLAYRLIRAIFDLFLAKTEYVCYFLMILTFLLEGSILSLPLPLLAFSWGMLAIPSPGHRFWITVMTYEMLVVIVKFIFQFPLGVDDTGLTGSAQRATEMPWSTFNDVAKLFGVNKRNNFALLDILLLVSLFLHRFMLKRYGLWKPAEVPPTPPEPAPISPTGVKNTSINRQSDLIQPRSGSKKAKPGSILTKSAPQISVTTISDTGDQQSVSLMEASTGDPGVDVEYIDADLESDPMMDTSDATGCCSEICHRIKVIPRLVQSFFTQLTSPGDRSPRDLYAFIFAADFCALLTTVFAYDKFGPSSYKAQAVLDLLQSDVVPIPFVILLLVQFSFLMVDRALYIRKLAVGKLIFQIFLLVLVHIITLFVLPLPTVTNIAFSQNTAVQVWYFFKCAYFAFSAYQIKFGYPKHVATHFLTRQYNYLMWLLLKGFMVIPFLLELRTIMDWVFTPTTLSWRYWLITDLCYYEVFAIKCERRMEEKYPTTRGVPRAWMYKIHGLLFLAGIVFILWFPFLLFSFGDLMVMPADMLNVRMDIRLSGTSQSVFAFGVDTEAGGLYRMNEKQYEILAKCFKDRNQQLAYTQSDIWIAKIGSNSQTLWTLSPPALHSLEMTLQNESLVNMSVATTFTVNRNQPTKQRNPNKRDSNLPIYNNKMIMTNETRSALFKLLMESQTNRTNLVTFPYMVPQYLIVDRNGAMEAFQLPNCPSDKKGSSEMFFNATMSLVHQPVNVEERWWTSSFTRTESPSCDCQKLQLKTGNETELVVISAPVKAEVLTLLDRLGTSIIGVYSAVVLVVHRLLRSSLIEGANYKVMFTELPRCDRVWRLLNEIYIVRQFGVWELEEELMARLIFLYRSPQTMIDQTRQIGLI